MDLDGKKEKLSALMDNELTADEKSTFLDELQQNKELQKSWQIYHLIKNAIKRKHDFYRSFDQPAVIHTQVETKDGQESQEKPGS